MVFASSNRPYKNILETIGNTPILELNRIPRKLNIKPKIYVKCEFFNPGGSVKDRIGVRMMEEAERKRLIKPNGVIVEPTSGNTGIGLALFAVTKGYRTVFVMPEKMSREKELLLRAYGAEIIRTPIEVGPEDFRSHYKAAELLVRMINSGRRMPTDEELGSLVKNLQSLISGNRIRELEKLWKDSHGKNKYAYLPNQYENEINPLTHYLTTGPEIWEQTNGKITHFIAGIGTGGTITGVAKFLKEKNPKIKIIGVDPEGSVIAKQFHAGSYEKEDARPYKVEGIGEDKIPKTLDLSLVDNVITVGDDDSFAATRSLAKEEGLLVGGSSGAVLFAALKASGNLDENSLVVVLLPDTGKNYLSKIFSDDWVAIQKFLKSGTTTVTAQDILNKKSKNASRLIYVGPSDDVAYAIDLMKEHGISQMPVIEDNVQLGSVDEISLMKRILQGKEGSVRQVMGRRLPEVNLSTEIGIIQNLIFENPAVLVKDKNIISGIITKMDIINFFAR